MKKTGIKIVDDYLANLDGLLARGTLSRSALLKSEIRRFERYDRELEAWAASDRDYRRPCHFDAFHISMIRNALFARLERKESRQMPPISDNTLGAICFSFPFAAISAIWLAHQVVQTYYAARDFVPPAEAPVVLREVR